MMAGNKDIKRGNYLFNVAIFIKPNVTVHKRSIYTILDWLGDIGGLLDALICVAKISLGFYSLVFGS